MPSASLLRRSRFAAVTHCGTSCSQLSGPLSGPTLFRVLSQLYLSCSLPAHASLLSTRPTTSCSVAHGSAPLPRHPCPAARCARAPQLWPCNGNMACSKPPRTTSNSPCVHPVDADRPQTQKLCVESGSTWGPASPPESELPLLGTSPG